MRPSRAPHSSAAGREAMAEYRSEQRREARDTTLIGGVVGLASLLSFALLDRLLLPEAAGRFFVVRLLVGVALAACCGALWWRRLGGRWPEQLAVLTIAMPQLAVAWMIPRSGEHLEAYLLFLSLAIYAAGFLLVWTWRMTCVLSVISAAAIAGFSIGANSGFSAPEIGTIVFYVCTAATLSVTAQAYRERRAWQQHVTYTELEASQRRNEVLVQELDLLTRQDPLTSVGNRRAWEERLTGEFLRARRSGRPLSVIVCDFDHFKAVNDFHGHNVGDRVLCTAANLLVGRVRASDFVARLGGDEFAVLCPDTSLDAAVRLASQIGERTRLTEFPAKVNMTCSIGVAELERNDNATEALYHRADCALYEAKIARDTVRCAEPAVAASIGPGSMTTT